MFGLFVRRHAEVVSKSARVSVLYFAPATHQSAKGWNVIESDNLTEYIYYPKNIKFPLIGKLIRLLAFFYAMHKGFSMIRRRFGKPDITHVHILTRMGVIAQFIRIKFSIPYVITEHWSRYLPYPGTYRGSVRKCLTKWICKNACAVSTVTKNLGEALKNHGLIKDFMLINNVVDTELFSPKSNLQIDSNTVQIIHISCFEDRSKNISGLIDAFHQLRQEREDISLELVGDGVDRGMIENIVKEKKLEGCVHFHGVLKGQALVDKLASASFLVISSHYENMPVVIPEAFACGIPVLSTNVGGISEWVNDTNGLLVQANSSSALLEGLISMSENFKQYDRDLIRETALKHFSSQGVSQQFLSLYQTCFANEH